MASHRRSGGSAAATVQLGEPSRTAEGRRFEVSCTLLGQVGVAPEAVAGMVVDATHANRFWILTHPKWGDVLRRRVEAMLTTDEVTARAPD